MSGFMGGSFGRSTMLLRKKSHAQQCEDDARRAAARQFMARQEEGDSIEPTQSLEDKVVLHGECMVDSWATSGTNGRTSRLRILDTDLQVHPMKGLRCGRGRASVNGQRLRMVVQKSVEHEDEPIVLYTGEAVLTWWADDCHTGMRFSVRFSEGPESEDWHPFSGQMTGKNGDVVYVTAVAINESEEIEDPRDARSSRRPFAQLTPTQQSQIKCRLDTNFQRWAARNAIGLLMEKGITDLPEPTLPAQTFAEQFVRAYCGIQSRAEMSEDSQTGFMARDAWREIMRLYSESDEN